MAINYTPFRVSEFFGLSANSLLMPKKIYDQKKKRFLNLIELLSIADAFDIHYKGDFFADNHYTLVNNTATEIKEAVIEMHERQEKSWRVTEKRYLTDSRISAVYASYPDLERIANDLNITLSTTFLNRNPDLLSFN